MCESLNLSDASKLDAQLQDASTEELVVLQNLLSRKLGDNTMATEQDESTQDTVEETVEETVVETVEETVEEAVEETIQEAVEETVEETVTDTQHEFDTKLQESSLEFENKLKEKDEQLVALSNTLEKYRKHFVEVNADVFTSATIKAASSIGIIEEVDSVDKLDANSVLKVFSFAETAANLTGHSGSGGAEETQRKNKKVAEKTGPQFDFGPISRHLKKKALQTS